MDKSSAMKARCLREDYHKYILLPTPEAVYTAIMVFGGEIPSDALHENTRQIGDDVRRRGGNEALAVGMFLTAFGGLGGQTRNFTRRVAVAAKEACERHEQRDHDTIYYGSWDYDGPGPFHKCSLNVKKVPGPDGSMQFALDIHAAYVGSKPEERLAKELRTEQGICHVTFTRGFECESDRFKIPVAEVVKVWELLGLTATEADVAQIIARNTNRHSDADVTGVVLRHPTADIQVSIYLSHLTYMWGGERRDHNQRIMNEVLLKRPIPSALLDQINARATSYASHWYEEVLPEKLAMIRISRPSKGSRKHVRRLKAEARRAGSIFVAPGRERRMQRAVDGVMRPWFRLEHGYLTGPARVCTENVRRVEKVKNPRYTIRRMYNDYGWDRPIFFDDDGYGYDAGPQVVQRDSRGRFVRGAAGVAKRYIAPPEPEYLQREWYEEVRRGYESVDLCVSIAPSTLHASFQPEIKAEIRRLADRLQGIWPLFGDSRYAD